MTVIMIAYGFRTWYTCNLFVRPGFFILWSNWTLSSLISIIRYLMAWKASQTRIIKPKYLFATIIMSAMVPYFATLGNWLATSSDKSGKMLAACLDQTDGNDFSKTLLFINIFLIIICIGTGLYFDISMLVFVKKRNQIQPLQLVPWKSVSPKSEKDDQTVPLWASCVSTATLIFFAILAPVYVELVNTIDPENGDKEHQFWTVASILILVSIPTLPLLLIFTIKQKKTQKVPSQPPNNLQFHDNGESHQGISHPLQFHENDNEENNENSIQVRDHP